MSDTRLNVNITATNTATTSVRELEQQIKLLEKELAALTRQAQSFGASAQAAFQGLAQGVRDKIAQINQAIVAQGGWNAVMRESYQEANYFNRALDAVAANTRKVAEEENRAIAAREESIRQALRLNNERVRAEQKAEDAAAAQAARDTRLIAEHENRDKDLAADKLRRTAEYENAQITAALTNNRALAEYENRDRDLAAARIQRERALAQKQEENAQRQLRYEAEYENAQRTAVANQIRLLAEHENRDRDLASSRLRHEAEYENAQRTASADQLRRMAELENADKDLAAARLRNLADYENRDRDMAYDRMRREADYENQQRDAAARARARAAAQQGSGPGSLNQEARHIVGFFDAIARGQFGQAISSIGAGLRDAGIGAVGLTAGIAGLAAVMGTSAIIRGADNMGRWATETRAAAEATGLSIQQFSLVQGALTLMGLKMEEANTSLRRLGINLAEAIADPTSKAAQGFHALGISQEYLVATGGNVEQALKLIANAFVSTEQGAQKNAAMEAVLGRGYENLIPILQRGANGLDELYQKVRALGGEATPQLVNKLDEVGQKTEELKVKMQVAERSAFAAWGDTIIKLIGWLEALGNTITKVSNIFAREASEYSTHAHTLEEHLRVTGVLPAGKRQIAGEGELYGPPTAPTAAGTRKVGAMDEIKPLEQMRNDMAAAAAAAVKSATTAAEASRAASTAEIAVMRKTLDEAKLTATQRVQVQTELNNKLVQLQREELSGVEGPVGTMRQQMTAAAALATQGATTARDLAIKRSQAEIGVMQQTLANAKLTAKERSQIETELNEKIMQLHSEQLTAGASAAKQSYRDFAEAEQQKIAEADGSSKKILAIYDEWLAAARSKYQQHADEIAKIEKKKVEAVNQARLQEISEGARLTEQRMRLQQLDQRAADLSRYGAGQGRSQTGPAFDLQTASRARAEAAQIDAIARQQIADLTEVMNTSEEGSKTQREAAQKIMDIAEQAKSREISLYEKAAQATAEAMKKQGAAFKQFFDEMGSDFASFGKSVIKSLIAPQQEIIHAGLTTIKRSLAGQEIKQAFSNLFTNMVSHLADSLGNAVSKMIANALSGGASNTIGELLGNWLGKAFSSIFPSLAGGATQTVAATTLTAAGTSLTAAGVGLDASSVSLDAAATALSAAAATMAAGGAAGGGGSICGSLFAAGVMALAGGGVIPSAANGMMVGGIDGRGGMLSILHPQEMVLPSPISLGLQAMIARGGGGSMFSSNASLNYSPNVNIASRGRGGTGMTRSEFNSMLSMHSGSLLGEARNMMRNGWRPS